ncbi:MAG: hypothetical protein ABEJ56_00790 [Candidatus Nanohaloarchaea archaeon]
MSIEPEAKVGKGDGERYFKERYSTQIGHYIKDEVERRMENGQEFTSIKMEADDIAEKYGLRTYNVGRALSELSDVVDALSKNNNTYALKGKKAPLEEGEKMTYERICEYLLEISRELREMESMPTFVHEMRIMENIVREKEGESYTRKSLTTEFNNLIYEFEESVPPLLEPQSVDNRIRNSEKITKNGSKIILSD